MQRITNTKVINNHYNKTVYTALTVIFVALGDYGIEVSTELQGAVTTFTMMLTTLLVKNRGKQS